MVHQEVTTLITNLHMLPVCNSLLTFSEHLNYLNTLLHRLFLDHDIIHHFLFVLFFLGEGGGGGGGSQWLSGRVLDSRPKGCGFQPHRRHCVVVLEQDTFILA